MSKKPEIFFKPEPGVKYGVEVHPIEMAAYWLAAVGFCVLFWYHFGIPWLMSLIRAIAGAF